jgi:hypothetical protein
MSGDFAYLVTPSVDLRVLDSPVARLIPSEFDLDPLVRDRHGPEARTLLGLRDGLGDGFVVYHGVHWTRADGSGSVYGEIDFIVANRGVPARHRAEGRADLRR